MSRLYDEALADTGLTTTQFAILRTLNRMGTQPLSRLAEELVMDRTSLYRTLKPIVRHGWLEIGEGGGRAKTAGLTAEGLAIMLGAEAAWEAAQARFEAAMGPEAWNGLYAGLRGAVDAAATA